jgi:ankyrin repeat protein
MHGSVEKMQAVVAANAAGVGTGVDVNAKEPHSDRTAMHKAAIFGHVHVIEYLMELSQSNTTSSISINAQDVEGDTPLHDAAKYGHVSVVAALLKAGADCTIANHGNKLAADLAQANGKDAVAAMLMAAVA